MTVFYENIKCPCCKSRDIEYKEIKRMLTIQIGEMIFSYWLCKDCGIMFQKV